MTASVSRGNIGTNLSCGEGEGFNPADEKRNVHRKMDIEMMSESDGVDGEEEEDEKEEEEEEEGDSNPI